MNSRTHVTRTVGCMFAASLTFSSFAWAQNANTVAYKLNPGSTYQIGCFPPCLCPLSQEFDVRGSFNLRFVGSDLLFNHYAVTDVDWTVLMNSFTDPGLPITGGGTYKIGGEFALTHRLELDLQIDGNLPQHFDSRHIVGGFEFPDITITVSINNLFCHDTVIVVNASPVGACCVALAGGISCFVGTEAKCLNQGGTYQGDGTTCPSDPSVPCGAPTGVCCQDISDGLIPYETCSDSNQDSCEAAGGVFHGINTSCAQVQACCLTFGSEGFCADLNPYCCADSGGAPQGAGSTCAKVVDQGGCGQVCGGIAGIPCDEGEFCKLPIGKCCCDFQGLCSPIPDICQGVWDPVCGCDGVTYGNECEADAAGVSVDHRGECGNGCKPTNDGIGCVPAPCSVIPEVSCIPTVLHLDITTGAITVVACECMDFNDCHVEFGNATPRPVGNCPDGRTCEVIGTDTDNDGIDDQFTATCAKTGACCVGLAGGISCFFGTEADCVNQGGMYQGDGTTCPSDPSVPCGSPCNVPCPPDQTCFSGCGLFIQGVECVLFKADSAGLFLLDNLGGFVVGDRVLVTGCQDPICVTICQQGNGCIHNNTIAPCGQVCGGIAGIPCDKGEFCKLPIGKCCCDFQGVCTSIPEGCPEIYDPVCGCDGVTYGNACEADAAGVSIDRRGECGTGACCLPNAAGVLSCFIGSETECLNQGGAYQGDGTTCPSDANVPCGVATGACCFSPNNVSQPACMVTTPQACAADGGIYQGDNIACDQNTCNCCFADGSCTNMPSDVCIAEGGFLRENAVIPTVSEWGLIVSALLVLAAGTLVINRRRMPVTA